MLKPVKALPPDYLPAGGVSIRKKSDLLQMLVWSIVLPVICLIPILLILLVRGAAGGSFTFNTGGNLLKFLGGVLLVTIVMLVLHEGLHGLVFWFSTGEAPKFEFKWYYASASPGEWYLPRRPFMLATLLPLIAITAAGLLLLFFVGGLWRYLIIVLVVANASGAAGDFLVALRLAKLPSATLARDTGAEVSFFIPPGGQ
jgi:hypothetical protein